MVSPATSRLGLGGAATDRKVLLVRWGGRAEGVWDSGHGSLVGLSLARVYFSIRPMGTGILVKAMWQLGSCGLNSNHITHRPYSMAQMLQSPCLGITYHPAAFL